MSTFRCGDGMCDADRESCALCPGDCGMCSTFCGDGTCDAAFGETNASCAVDCPAM